MDEIEAFLYFGKDPKDTKCEAVTFKGVEFMVVENDQVIKENGKLHCSCSREVCYHKYIVEHFKTQ